MIRKILLIPLFVISLINLNAQVGINILNPDSSAVLQLESTDKGFALPRMTTSQMNAISNPLKSLMIYNDSDSLVRYWNGECWLYTFQTDCDECFFDMTADIYNDTIDRLISSEATFEITVDQFIGAPSNIALNVVNSLPAGLDVTFTPNPINSSGSSLVTISVTDFYLNGFFPIIFEGYCGSNTNTLVYGLYIEPCLEVPMVTSEENYNLSDEVEILYPGATSIPVCVINYVSNGVNVRSATSTLPAYSTGNFATGSLVALYNNGNILGQGGNGGTAAGFIDPAAGLQLGNGEDGGNAIEINTTTTIVNNANIFAGGGGGASMAFGFVFDINDFVSIPINIPGIGILVGAGGGGGAPAGVGGDVPNLIGFYFYDAGTDATNGLTAVAGEGGDLNLPIDFSQSVVEIYLTPAAEAGDGGEFAYPGQGGNFALYLTVNLVVNIPFVGPITIPIVSNIEIPISTLLGLIGAPLPSPGEGGYAIKHNGNTINLTDNFYNTSYLKGLVGP